MKGRSPEIIRRTADYYTGKLRQHGCTARGVDWNSEECQRLRFDQLLRLFEVEDREFTLNDYGCGYGALVEHLAQRGLTPAYHGLDVSEAMIRRARQRWAGRPHCRFTTRFDDLETASYTVASGVFNVKQQASEEEWLSYLRHCLDQMHSVSRRGFAFNVLTRDSDSDRRERRLYYADPVTMLRYCQRSYSRWVALLQDYGLYEMTVVVRRDESREWPS